MAFYIRYHITGVTKLWFKRNCSKFYGFDTAITGTRICLAGEAFALLPL